VRVAISERSSSKPAGTGVDETERLAEIAALLAAGLVRLNARKSSQNSRLDGESSLHCSLDQSIHEPVHENRERA
jgi:hypothetical protein